MTNMKVHHAIITAAISLTATIPQSAAAQRHEIFSEDIKSLQVVYGGKWLSMPVMQLCGSSPDNVTNISLDDLTHTYRRYTYSIEHCEADWTTSDGLFQSDYIDGFANDNTIEDIEESGMEGQSGTEDRCHHHIVYRHADLCVGKRRMHGFLLIVKRFAYLVCRLLLHS